MDEQRIAAYVDLIKQLLNCSDDNQIGVILQAHPELLDQGLIAVMLQAAEQIGQQGNEPTATWLQNLAQQLAQAMGLQVDAEAVESSSDALQFIGEIFQCIVENQGASEPVYRLLAANQARLNGELLVAFPAVASALLGKFAGEEQHGVAELIFIFGNLIAQFPLGQRAINMELAITAYEEVLQVMTREAMPREWATAKMNLAIAYSDRIRGERAANLEAAITAYEQALKIFQPEQHPNDCRKTARSLGNLYADHQRWPAAVETYGKALQAAEILYQASLSRFGQEAELAETFDLFRRAAYAQAQAGNLQEAVVTLERGRARGLSETLERDRSDLADLETNAPEVYQQYQRAVADLRQLEMDERSVGFLAQGDRPAPSPEELPQRAAKVRQEFQAAIAAIRQQPGYADFLAQADFKNIAATVHPDLPLVYLNPTANGGLALVVYKSLEDGAIQIEPLWLNALTEASLQELLAGWFGAFSQFRQAPKQNYSTWLEAIDVGTRQLWDLLMAPLIAHLNQHQVQQAILIPTGFLSFLPLHAAWTEDATTPTGRRYALDTIQFSYIPNAQSLQVARNLAHSTPANSLLAINEPRPTQANDLPNSEREVQAARSYFPHNQPLKHEQATRSAVLAALPHHDILHFSCHGYANFDNPLESGLLMANDELLTLRDFFNLKLQGIRLAILSACETGLPGAQLPDEVVSLPTALLQTGVAGVAASLWSVSDLSTMMLLARFYDFWRKDGLEPAAALQKAQQWVRDTSNREKITYFKGFIPEFSGSRMAAQTADFLYKQVILAHPDDRDFAHPFHWAAFSYTGV